MSAAVNPIPPTNLSAAAGGTGGNDGNDPSRRKSLDPIHAIDAEPIFPEDYDEEEGGDGACKNLLHPSRPTAGRKQQVVPTGPQQCNICNKIFNSIKALHGHMRSHPFRKWVGVSSMQPLSAEQEILVNSLMLMSGQGPRKRRFICTGCNREFPTRQALGGHRASHKGQKGCYEKAKEAREYGPKGGKRKNKGNNIIRAKEAEQALTAASIAPFTMTTSQASPVVPSTATTILARPIVGAASTSTRPVEETSSTTTGVRRRKLDLNLLPTSSDDTNGGNGNGSSSSSMTKGDRSELDGSI